MTKHSEAIVRLENEIQNQNLKLISMENKHREKAVIMNKHCWAVREQEFHENDKMLK